MDVSINFNEIKHELSLLKGYSLPLDKCIMLSALINFRRLLGGVTKKRRYFAEGKQCQNSQDGEKGSVHKEFFYLILYE